MLNPSQVPFRYHTRSQGPTLEVRDPAKRYFCRKTISKIQDVSKAQLPYVQIESSKLVKDDDVLYLDSDQELDENSLQGWGTCKLKSLYPQVSRHHNYNVTFKKLTPQAQNKKSPVNFLEVNKFGIAAFANEGIKKEEFVLTLDGSVMIGSKEEMDAFIQHSKCLVFSVKGLALQSFGKITRAYQELNNKDREFSLLILPLGDATNILSSAKSNLKIKMICDDKEGLQVELTAKRDIKKNEALTVDYDDILTSQGISVKKPDEFPIVTEAQVPYSPKMVRRFNQADYEVQLRKDDRLEPLAKHPWLADFLERVTKRKRLEPLPQKFLPRLLECREEIEEGHLMTQLCYGKLEFGLGVFLKPDAKRLKKGELVGFYSGALRFFQEGVDLETDYTFSLLDLKVKREERDELFKRDYLLNSKLPDDLLKVDDISVYVDLDARFRGNYSRFFNHSSQFPNLEIRVYTHDKKPIIVFQTKCDVEPGEQFLFDYESRYWDPRQEASLVLSPRSHLD